MTPEAQEAKRKVQQAVWPLVQPLKGGDGKWRIVWLLTSYGCGKTLGEAWLDAASRLPNDAGVEEPAKATEAEQTFDQWWRAKTIDRDSWFDLDAHLCEEFALAAWNAAKVTK